MSTRTRFKQGTALLALVVALIGGWEGLRTVAYPDQLAGGIPTVCFGETRGVKLGDEYTADECRAMLGDAIVEFEERMRACLREPDAVPAKSYVAFTSLSYNIGSRAFCGSTVARRANAGNYAGACDAILWWNKAGGKVVQGLVNRRKDEHRLCMEGVREAQDGRR
jgi:lysozyme